MAETPKQRLPSVRRVLAISVLCSIVAGLFALLVGFFFGLAVYPYFTTLFNNTFYPPGLFHGFSDKVQLQTGIHFALWFGSATFWTVLAVPWLRLALLYYKNRSKRAADV